MTSDLELNIIRETTRLKRRVFHLPDELHTEFCARIQELISEMQMNPTASQNLENAMIGTPAEQEIDQ